jgi:hypothetical protein
MVGNTLLTALAFCGKRASHKMAFPFEGNACPASDEGCAVAFPFRGK